MNVNAGAEVIIPGGLVVFRKAMEPDFSASLASECEQLHSVFTHNIGLSDSIRSKSNRLSDVHQLLGPAAKSVVDYLEIPIQSLIIINEQQPFAEQGFHQDGTESVVLYPETRGAYDYNSLNPWDDETVKPTPVSAGDVLFSGLSRLYHRGRNTTPFLRHTMTILIKQ